MSLAFSQDWAENLARELRASDAYRAAAETWEGPLVLALAPDGDDGDEDHGAHAAFLDLWHGECRDARAANDDDRSQAEFLIAAGADAWRRVLAGELEPIFALMSGKLKLVRGSLAKLLPQAIAARELVAAATRINTVFPGE